MNFIFFFTFFVITLLLYMYIKCHALYHRFVHLLFLSYSSEAGKKEGTRKDSY